MITFKALGDKYSFPQDLTEVTLGKFIEYCELEKKYLPLQLQELLQLQEELAEIPETDKLDRRPVEEKIDLLFEEVNSVDFQEVLIHWYSRIVSFWTGLKYELIIGEEGAEGGMDIAQLKALAIKLQELVNNPPEVEYSNVIEFKEELYYLPVDNMKEATVIEYLEASQMYKIQEHLAAGQWSALAKVICILLRKKDEKYNKKLLKREKYFLDLPMNKAYQVAFFLLNRIGKLKTLLATYTQAQALKKLEQELNS